MCQAEGWGYPMDNIPMATPDKFRTKRKHLIGCLSIVKMADFTANEQGS